MRPHLKKKKSKTWLASNATLPSCCPIMSPSEMKYKLSFSIPFRLQSRQVLTSLKNTDLVVSVEVYAYWVLQQRDKRVARSRSAWAMRLCLTSLQEFRWGKSFEGRLLLQVLGDENLAWTWRSPPLTLSPWGYRDCSGQLQDRSKFYPHTRSRILKTSQ